MKNIIFFFLPNIGVSGVKLILVMHQKLYSPKLKSTYWFRNKFQLFYPTTTKQQLIPHLTNKRPTQRFTATIARKRAMLKITAQTLPQRKPKRRAPIQLNHAQHGLQLLHGKLLLHCLESQKLKLLRTKCGIGVPNAVFGAFPIPLQLTPTTSHQLPMLLWLNQQTQTIFLSFVGLSCLMNDSLAGFFKLILSYWTLSRTLLLNPWPPLYFIFSTLFFLCSLCFFATCGSPLSITAITLELTIASPTPSFCSICSSSDAPLIQLHHDVIFVLAVGCLSMLFSPLMTAH